MNNDIKRNQSQSNMELDFISDKLNLILITLDKTHIKSDYDDRIVEDEAHKFDGISYENKCLSESILGKIKHNNGLIDKILHLNHKKDEPVIEKKPTIVIPPKEVESLIPERDFHFKKGHPGKVKKVQ